MGELIFTFCYGGALIAAGVLVKAITSRQAAEQVKKKEVMSKSRKQGSVI
ncbi:hypothetical protein [Bacillus norwichensis]|uniref:Uncharacterized protein n=1 Tax=Bacillus norwichensis TaxID=2762217 RepID=A0ABR8VN71_9BACI|nr:hypothetical protein [Bacillus norwichensis]MBD8006205.1 hypothetical protein [Bacillus norwichensis]